MRRRQVLAVTGVSASATIAGCLGLFEEESNGNGNNDNDSSLERDISAVSVESDHEEVTATVAIESHFTEKSPGITTVEMTNHDVERTFVFPGFEIPEFGSLDHDDEDAVVRTFSTDHFDIAPPAEPTQDCWVYELVPPRPDVFAPKTLAPGEGVTAEFSLSAMPENDSVPEPCLPVGSYRGASEIDYSEDPEWEDDIDGTVSLTLEITLAEETASE